MNEQCRDLHLNFHMTAYKKRVIEKTCVFFGNNGYSHVILCSKIFMQCIFLNYSMFINTLTSGIKRHSFFRMRKNPKLSLLERPLFPLRFKIAAKNKHLSLRGYHK